MQQYTLLDDVPGEIADDIETGFTYYSLNKKSQFGTYTPIMPETYDNILVNPLVSIDPNELNKKCGLPPAYFISKDIKADIEKVFKQVKWIDDTTFEGEYSV